MALDRYRKKRDFRRTPEPSGAGARARATHGLAFVVQRHAARRLHYDFRLELDGVLKSWAVPKGPSLDPADKRLAVHVEDHPLDYGGFEGVIPPGEYGAGTVEVWDRGEWVPREDPHEGYRKGRLKFELVGEKLHGGWTLARMGGRAGEGGKNWLLLKERDAAARAADEFDVLVAHPESVRDRPTVAGAPRAPLPRRLAPQLATLAAEPPAGDGWVHELKYDGYRALCRVEDGEARVYSRSGKDWTAEMAPIARAAAALPVKEAWLDGEVVVLRPDGRASFQALQNALASGRDDALTYYVFDLPYLDGHDLRHLPLTTRKQALASLVARAGGARDVVRYGDHVEGRGDVFFRHASEAGAEGIVSKRADSPYVSRRTGTWLKIRGRKRQEFVVGGFTEPARSRIGFGALLVGVNDDGRLVYAGRVGTGFDDATLRRLRAELGAREIATSPFVPGEEGGTPPKGSHFVRPDLVAEVEFTEWTDDGQLRQPVFLGLRADKTAGDVVRERPVPLPPRSETDRVAGVRLTHPDRVLFPDPGVTKGELAAYYQQVAARMVPHLEGRPLSLVRAPEGYEGERFFHKHVGKGWPDALGRLPVREGGREVVYATVADAAGLVALAQMDVLEIHPWGSRAGHIERPDRMIFDLDPDPALPWRRIVEATAHTRVFLHDLGLDSFVKTTGGKGLHVVVPIEPRGDWDEVKAFAEAVARTLARRDPERFTASMAKQSRTGRVYVDYVRNARGQTAVAAYSTRARAGAPVSTPLRWDELLGETGADRWNVRNLVRRVHAQKEDPWAALLRVRQSISAEMRREVAAAARAG